MNAELFNREDNSSLDKTYCENSDDEFSSESMETPKKKRSTLSTASAAEQLPAVSHSVALPRPRQVVVIKKLNAVNLPVTLHVGRQTNGCKCLKIEFNSEICVLSALKNF